MGYPIYISVVLLGEMMLGDEKVKHKDPARPVEINFWIQQVKKTYDGRMPPIDEANALEWGRLLVLNPTVPVDCMLAATAGCHQLTLVSRNEKHLAGFCMPLFNPFTE